MTRTQLPVRLTATLFVCSVAFGAFACRHNPNATTGPSASPETSLERPSPSPIDFVDYYGYIKQASLTCRDLPSADAANEALNSQLPHGDPLNRIVKRGFKINSEKNRVGRRVVTWFCCGKEGQSVAHIYWTDGPKFCDIIAASIKEALAFEESHKL